MRKWVMPVTMVVVMAQASFSWGQGVSLEAFRPAMDSRGLVTVNASETLGHLDLSFGLVTTWGRRVLELEQAGERYRVDNLVTPALQAALGLFGVAELGVGVPFHVMDGDFTGQGIGDVGVHGKVRLVDGERQPLGLALIASVGLPAHEAGTWLGEDRTTLEPSLVIDKTLGRARLAANVGYRHRPERTLMVAAMSMSVGPEVPFGVGAAWALVPGRFEVIGEVYGGAPLRGQSWYPLEAVAGIKVRLAESSFFTMGGGGGSADTRAFVGIVFEPPIGDGRGDRVADEPPAEPAPDPPAPPAPEPAPNPNADRDGDGIRDAADVCPNVPENVNGIEDDDGCPDRKVLRRSDGVIDVLENVYFETDSAAILPESFGILDALADAVRGWPDIRVLEVQGHADERGSDAHNLRLTQARAESVVRYLTEKGIDARRLRPRGYGETVPVAPGHDEVAWSQNRRVQFIIVER